MANVIYVKMPRGNVFFPKSCPQCSGAVGSATVKLSSDHQQYSIGRRKYLNIRVPYCDACAAKLNRIRWIGRIVLGIGIVASILLSIKLDLKGWADFGMFMALCLPGIAMLMFLKGPVRISHFDDKTMTFSFESKDYADRFREINPGSA